MADAESIDDLLGSEVDENAVNAMVGDLEFHLASPTNKEPSRSLSEPSVNNNHITSAVPCNASTTTLISPTTFSNSKGLCHQNNTLNSNVLSSSKSSSSDAGILGISSIINSSSTPVSGANGSGLSILNVNTLNMTRGSADNSVQKPQNAPTVRVVAQPPLCVNSSFVQISTANPATYVNSVVNAGSVHAVSGAPLHGAAGASVTLGANSNNNNSNFSVTIASSDQEAATASQNGSVHSQTDPKSGTVIASRVQSPFVLKTESSTGGGASPFIIKQQDSRGSKPEVTFSLPSSTGQVVSNQHLVQTTLKGVQTLSNNSVIAVRTPNQQAGGAVLRPAGTGVMTPVAGSVQIVQVTSGGMASTRPTIVTQAKPTQARVTVPARITQQPNQVTIAPRQNTGLGGQTLQNLQIHPSLIGPGSVLLKNDQGQLIMVQGQNLINPGVSTAHKVQQIRPQGLVGAQRLPTGAPAIVTIQQGKGTRLQTAVLPPGSVAPGTVMQAVSGATLAQPQPALPGMGTATITTTSTANAAASQAANTNKQIVENVQKCKNFLSTLIKLASSQPPETVKNVRDLIQGLIDGQVEPEAFTTKLQIELKSSPQPYLVPFLKKSLPLLRSWLIQKKMTIEGVRPPPPESLQTSTVPTTITMTTAALQSQRPIMTMVPQPVQKSRLLESPVTMEQNPWSWEHGREPQYHNSLQNIPPWQQQLAAKMPVQALRLSTPAKMVMPVSKARISMATTPATVSALQAHAQAKTDSHTRPEKRKFESLKDDDDINDVATMGGVNLSEESKNILATNAEYIGTTIRSCKDETFLSHGPLLNKILAIARKRGLEDVSPEVANIISHATQERLRELVMKLDTISEHRLEHYKVDSRYEQTKDVKMQLKFLEELDTLENKRHKEQEREILIRAMKSRSKSEDPEQVKLKQKAKELQMMEQEQNRQRAANETAMMAIGPRKKKKLDMGDLGQGSGSGSGGLSNGIGSGQQSGIPFRPRIKRVNMKDLVLMMEQEKSMMKSNLLYRTILK